MKRILRQFRSVPFLVALMVTLTTSTVFVYAQASLSGDEICGATSECAFSDIGRVLKGALSLLITLGLPVLVVFIAIRFLRAYLAAVQGNAYTYKKAMEESMNAFGGFLFIVALFSGLLILFLRYFGVKSDGQFNPFMLLKEISTLFLPHVYAASGQFLPNTLTSNSLYEVIISLVRLVMRFFVYPALVAMWTWTGFAFVLAQGRPAELAKAKGWLVKALITSLVIFTLQAFLVAAQGTVKKILPGTGAELGTPGTACLLDKRIQGTFGQDGLCHSNSSGTSNSGTDANLPTPQEVAQDPRFSPTYCSSCLVLKGTAATVSGGATLSGTYQGFRYYSDGTVIGPDGTYYRDDKPIWSPPVYTCPDGKTKYFDQSDYRIVCSSVAPTTPSAPYVDQCPSLNQVHSSCTARNGRAGTCLLDVFTKPQAPYFVCVPK